MRFRSRFFEVLVSLTAFSLAFMGLAPGAPAQIVGSSTLLEALNGTAPGLGQFTPPRVSGSSDLADSALRDAVARIAGGQPAGLGLSLSGNRILVDVRHNLTSSSVRSLLASLGASVYREIGSG